VKEEWREPIGFQSESQEVVQMSQQATCHRDMPSRYLLVTTCIALSLGFMWAALGVAYCLKLLPPALDVRISKWIRMERSLFLQVITLLKRCKRAVGIRWAYEMCTRGRRAEDDLEEALLIMGSCLRSGANLVQAINCVAGECRGSFGKAMRQVMDSYKVGKSISLSLEEVSSRLDHGLANNVARALAVHHITGGNVLEIIEAALECARDEKTLKEKARALSAEARWSAVIVAILPPLLAAYMFKYQTDTMRFFLADLYGKVAFTYTVASWVVGILVLGSLTKSSVGM